MKKFNNKSGFTLIEIIVVLIIVGILAAIALPNLFGNVQKSKSSQALTILDAIKTNVESCLAVNSAVVAGAAPCTTALMATPSNGAGWTYTIPAAGVAQSATGGGSTTPAGTTAAGTAVYSLSASDGTNTVVLNRAAAGTWTCSVGTTSPYQGVC